MLSACVCPSVCLSQAGIVSKRLDESSWFWARRLRSTYPTLCYKEIGVSPKIRVRSTSSGTLSQTLDLENFATASRRYASAVLAMALSVCLSVCLSVSITSRCYVETSGQIELGLERRVSSTYPTLCCEETRASKHLGSLPSGTLSRNSGLRSKFRHGTSIVATCCQRSSTLVDAHSAIYWTSVGQFTMPASVYG